MMLLEQSDWTYHTSTTGGLGLGLFAGSGGRMLLKDTRGTDHSYWYGSAGVGFGDRADLTRIPALKVGKRSFRIPNLPPIHIRGKSFTAGGSLDVTPSGGWIFRNGTLGRELGSHDFNGAAVVIEGGGGLYIAGAAADIMVLGMSPLQVGAALASPLGTPLLVRAIATAPAFMITWSIGLGSLQVGWAVAAMAGLVYGS